MAVATVDNKKRITLKEARPGEVYDVEFIGGGHFRLRRMRREPEPKTRDHPETDLAPSEQ